MPPCAPALLLCRIAARQSGTLASSAAPPQTQTSTPSLFSRQAARRSAGRLPGKATCLLPAAHGWVRGWGQWLSGAGNPAACTHPCHACLLMPICPRTIPLPPVLPPSRPWLPLLSPCTCACPLCCRRDVVVPASSSLALPLGNTWLWRGDVAEGATATEKALRLPAIPWVEVEASRSRQQSGQFVLPVVVVGSPSLGALPSARLLQSAFPCLLYALPACPIRQALCSKNAIRPKLVCRSTKAAAPGRSESHCGSTSSAAAPWTRPRGHGSGRWPRYLPQGDVPGPPSRPGASSAACWDPGLLCTVPLHAGLSSCHHVMFPAQDGISRNWSRVGPRSVVLHNMQQYQVLVTVLESSAGLPFRLEHVT